MFFWNSLAFLMIQWMLAIWSLIPLPFLKPAWTSGSSWFMYCWSLTWRILSITSVWDEHICAVVWAFFAVAFLWDWNENWPFPVLWPLLSFPDLLTLSAALSQHRLYCQIRWILMDIYIFYNFIYFWLLYRLAFSHCSEQGLLSRCGAQASHCSSFSWAARAQ